MMTETILNVYKYQSINAIDEKARNANDQTSTHAEGQQKMTKTTKLTAIL